MMQFCSVLRFSAGVSEAANRSVEKTTDFLLYYIIPSLIRQEGYETETAKRAVIRSASAEIFS